MNWEDYDDAENRKVGQYHRSVERDSGHTIYMFDSEGNYLNCISPTRRQASCQA
jgi:hypothetical protein